jgi:lipoate-protein ligase A
VLDSYRVICEGIVRALRELGLNASFAGVNDVVVNGRKISGSAQTRRFGGVLQHGTLLMDVDVEEMFSLLRVPSEKVRDKMIKSVKDRVTSLKSEGVDADFRRVADALARGFAEAMNLKLVEGTLTEKEMSLARELEVEKYGNDAWNFRR